MSAAPTLEAQMEAGHLQDIRAIGFLNRHIGPDNWHQETVKLSDWDQSGSGSVSQTRPGEPDGVMEAAVLQYGLFYDLGGTPPPIIIARKAGEPVRFYTLDGHQRCTTAVRKGKDTIVAYVVEVTDQETLFFLSATANDEINGRRNTDVDKRRQVEYALEHYGHLSNKEMARRLHVSETMVSDIKNTDATRKRLDSLGLDYSKLDSTVLKLLGQIQDDSVLTMAVEIAIDKHLTVPQTQDMVAAAKQGRSEAERLALVEEFAKRADISAQGHRTNNGSTNTGSTRRPARPYWVRLLDEGSRFNHRLTGAQPEEEHLDTLRDLILSINSNARRLLGNSLNGAVAQSGARK